VADLDYLYRLSLVEKQEFEKLSCSAHIEWINTKLQEAFNLGRNFPIEKGENCDHSKNQ
jgi:hypothetical protein